MASGMLLVLATCQQLVSAFVGTKGIECSPLTSFPPLLPFVGALPLWFMYPSAASDTSVNFILARWLTRLAILLSSPCSSMGKALSRPFEFKPVESKTLESARLPTYTRYIKVVYRLH
ncbi:hypothetical protein F5Y05DRAFT_345255 [Hypoxylon sp. FL0543]|nr:hypothetical protein F5Y05DRAFT_345255 [Hypoxylon sp. FL0543]